MHGNGYTEETTSCNTTSQIGLSVSCKISHAYVSFTQQAYAMYCVYYDYVFSFDYYLSKCRVIHTSG